MSVSEVFSREGVGIFWICIVSAGAVAYMVGAYLFLDQHPILQNGLEIFTLSLVAAPAAFVAGLGRMRWAVALFSYLLVAIIGVWTWFPLHGESLRIEYPRSSWLGIASYVATIAFMLAVVNSPLAAVSFALGRGTRWLADMFLNKGRLR